MPGCRQAAGTQRSSTLSTRSTPRKKLVQESQWAVRRDGWPRSARNSSAMPSSRRQRSHRLEIRHDRQRHDDRPRPRRHRTQAEAQPRRDQDQLGRNARALVVADLAQQREVKASEAVAARGHRRHQGSPAAHRTIAGSSGDIPTSLSAKYALTEALMSVGPPG